MVGRQIPRAGEIYRHFKNKMYQIVAVASHTETGEQLVVYEALYDDFKMYARPLSMFLSEVDRKNYPEATQKYRFELIEREVDGTLKMGYPVKPESIQEDAAKEEVVKVSESVEEKTESSPEKENAEVKTEVKTEDKEEQGYLDDDDEINPFLLKFLDTDSYGEKLEVLISIRSRLDDRLIDDMATAIDVIVEEGPLPVRYEGLKTCLETMVKFECERFR